MTSPDARSENQHPSGPYIVLLDGVRFWQGEFPTEDGAKQMLRRFQREFNRKGYDPKSERLSVGRASRWSDV